MSDRDNKYDRKLMGIDGIWCVTDIYRVLTAFNVSSPAIQHAVKKLLCSGLRGVKNEETDYREAIKSVEARLLEMVQVEESKPAQVFGPPPKFVSACETCKEMADDGVCYWMSNKYSTAISPLQPISFCEGFKKGLACANG